MLSREKKEKKKSETIKKPEKRRKFNLIFVPFDGAALRETFKAFRV
jgi:hypothetical protein